ncbi:hypothetical protein EG329_012605 [Mollisiaceae sp. DMI_Dod_QoI]|nr:hypothetical protein EG329_012605 [Helotiales sp. DMI_Dod_QoI]
MNVESSQPPKGEHPYKRLDPLKNQIRLLKILPVRLVDGEEQGVECSLFVTSLDDTPKYKALSYAWGEQSNDREVVLDDRLFRVSSNLYSALWQLQSYSRIKTFWIDALCINQNDNLERSEQVSKMRTIYERAENVVVWLGPTSASTSSAFSLLEDLYQHRLQKGYIASYLESRIENLEAIAKLFGREYWDRIWVVQEVNSAKKITVQCGRYTIDWLKMKAVQEMLWADHDRYILEISSAEPRLSGLSFAILWGGVNALEIRRRDPSSTLPDLYTTLTAFSPKRATDPRDRIFALVSLTTARDDPRFTIDYSASLRQVYIDVAKYILASSKKLDVICSMPRGYNELNLPSWVSDWAVSESKFGDALGAMMQGRGDPFGSAGSSTAEVELKHNDEVLVADGFVLGRIQVVGRKGSLESPSDFRAAMPVLLNWYKLFTLKRGTTAAQIDAFCRVIFYDRFHSKDFVYNSEIELMQRLLGAIALLAQENSPSEEVDPQLVTWKETHDVSKWWAKSWIGRACRGINCQRLFLSNTGLAGRCPDLAEPGDIICILLGCCIPVILRPHDGHYLIIGGAYVHDYMYGKGMQEYSEGKFQLQQFEIH